MRLLKLFFKFYNYFYVRGINFLVTKFNLFFLLALFLFFFSLNPSYYFHKHNANNLSNENCSICLFLSNYNISKSDNVNLKISISINLDFITCFFKLESKSVLSIILSHINIRSPPFYLNLS
jgi:hypothetical protein